MSITVSIYDLFAYTIPGVLYLFSFNELSRALGYAHIDIAQTGNLPSLLLLGLLGYLTGQIMDFVCHRLWIRIWHRTLTEERAYKQFRELHPGNISFSARQWPLLFTIIRHEDHETADMIDKNIASSIMLRNVSFGLFLFGLLQLFLAFRFGFSLSNLITVIGAFISSIIALRRSDYFNLMFYRVIFQHALLYNEKLSLVLGKEQNGKIKETKRAKAK